MWAGLRSPVFQTVLFAVVYYAIVTYNWQGLGEVSTDKLLVVGVLSAQNHFLQRQTVRNTWRTLLNSDIVFIVGLEVCPVPTSDRGSKFSCDEWSPSLTADNETVASNVRFASGNVCSSPLAGYTFVVKQNITLAELWLCSGALSHSTRLARVLLYDSLSGEIAASATFGYNPLQPVGEVLRKPVALTHLSSSFEGEIRVQGGIPGCGGHCPLTLAPSSPIHLFEGIDKGGQYIELPSLPSTQIAVGISYQLAEPNYWQRFDESRPARREEWNRRRNILKRQLDAEQNEHGDILFVNVTDVYRSLSLKSLAFLNWASAQQFEFVLKTDDDVFLDVDTIQRELGREVSTTWDWWSCFRVGWPAPKAGKWRNRFWPSDRKYPMFPSGAGYVIRSSSLRKILYNAHLSPQALQAVGEDVLVGHLASGAQFEMFRSTSCHWACEAGCQSRSCNVIELNSHEIEATWSKYTTCQQMCGCDIG